MRRLDGLPKRHTGTPRKGINFGEKNPAWTGGRMVIPAGYVFIRSVGHPRATKKGQYVFEHILVMEKHLGRFLSDGEEVHHKNGIKDDNRLENLELLSHSEHMHRHKKSSETKKKISEKRKAYWANLKIGEANSSNA